MQSYIFFVFISECLLLKNVYQEYNMNGITKKIIEQQKMIQYIERECSLKNELNEVFIFKYKAYDSKGHEYALSVINNYINKYVKLSKKDKFVYATRKIVTDSDSMKNYDLINFFQDTCATYLSADKSEDLLISSANDANISLYLHNSMNDLQKMYEDQQILFINNCLTAENDFGLFYREIAIHFNYYMNEGFRYIFVNLNFTSPKQKKEWLDVSFTSFFDKDLLEIYFSDIKMHRYEVNITLQRLYNEGKNYFLDSCYLSKNPSNLSITHYSYLRKLNDINVLNYQGSSLYYRLIIKEGWDHRDTNLDALRKYNHIKDSKKRTIECLFVDSAFTIYLITFIQRKCIAEYFTMYNLCTVNTDVIVVKDEVSLTFSFNYIADITNYKQPCIELYNFEENNLKLEKSIKEIDTFLLKLQDLFDKKFLSVEKHAPIINALK